MPMIRSVQSTSPDSNIPSRTTGSATTAYAPTTAETFAIETPLLQMQTQPIQPLTVAPPPPFNFVPSVDEVRARTAKPPTFGSTPTRNILDLDNATWDSITVGKREVLGVVAWLVARFGRNSLIVQDCYRLLPYIREPPSYPALPFGWKKAVDELGRRYYVNQVTGNSQWSRPNEPVSDYIASVAQRTTGSDFQHKVVSNELPEEATAQATTRHDTPRPRNEDSEWRPQWPITMPDTLTPRRSQRIRTMSERSTATTAADTAAAETETTSTVRRRIWQRQQSHASSLRRSTRLASHA